MARWIGEVPNKEHLGGILAAADAWRERCFMADGSVFLDEEDLWTPENVRELSAACPPATESHGTEEKSWSLLKEQVQQTRPKIARLAAEAVWLTDLYPTTQKVEAPSWKQNRFKDLWEESSPPPPDSEHLSDRTLRGVSNVPAQHWCIQHPLEFVLGVCRI